MQIWTVPNGHFFYFDVVTNQLKTFCCWLQMILIHGDCAAPKLLEKKVFLTLGCIRFTVTRAGIRLNSSNVVFKKVILFWKIINKHFVRQKLDFHAYVFFFLEGVQLAGPSAQVCSPVIWRASWLKKSHARKSDFFSNKLFSNSYAIINTFISAPLLNFNLIPALTVRS